jgi:Fe-S-cluster containining protein
MNENKDYNQSREKMIPTNNSHSDPTSTDFPLCQRKGDCCRSFPGWFAPGEVEKAAEFLGMTVDAFVRQYIIIDGITVEGYGWVDVFAPVRLNKHGEPALPPLSRADFFYRYFKGPCIFFKDNRCRIYPYRPVECRHYFCGQSPEQNLSHLKIAWMWIKGTDIPPAPATLIPGN